MAHIEAILSHWEVTAGPYGVTPPLELYWACYRVLQAAGDPRAGELLAEAHTLLQETAVKIDDERLRCSFLENVPHHRDLAQEYQRLHRTN